MRGHRSSSLAPLQPRIDGLPEPAAVKSRLTRGTAKAASVPGRADFPQSTDTGAFGGANNVYSYRITAVLVGTIIVACTIAALYLVTHPRATPIALATLLSVLLASLPILLCHVQGISRERQLARLNSLRDHPVSQTPYYASARTAIESIEPVSLDRYYLAPIMMLATVLAFGFLAILLATQLEELSAQETVAAGQEEIKNIFSVHSFLLGGQPALSMSGNELIAYQKETFLMLVMALTLLPQRLKLGPRWRGPIYVADSSQRASECRVPARRTTHGGKLTSTSVRKHSSVLPSRMPLGPMLTQLVRQP
jgi:hypothetical protein